MTERDTHLRRKSAELADVFNATDQVMPGLPTDDAVPRQADALQEGPGPAGKESDRDMPADDAVPRQADASQEGPGPAGKESDRDMPADDAVPRQADASQEGPGPAGKESDRDAPADDTAPQQADASQEGPGPAGKESDRKEEIFDLLKRAIAGGENPVLAAREFGARRDALLMETAAEIEEFERNIEATLHQLMHALAAVQKRVNHTIEESQGANNMREAMLAYKRIKSRFWESLVQSIREDMEQFKANLRREFQAVEDDFRAHIQELQCARLAPVPLRDRIEREKWLVLGVLFIGIALGRVLVPVEALWETVASFFHP